MGSPSYCYKQYMKEYVRLNVALTRYEKYYNEDEMSYLSEEELEKLVRQFNKSHPSYAHFLAGVAVAHCNEEWKNCGDLLNASGSAIGMLMELVGVYEPDNIDFEED